MNPELACFVISYSYEKAPLKPQNRHILNHRWYAGTQNKLGEVHRANGIYCMCLWNLGAPVHVCK